MEKLANIVQVEDRDARSFDTLKGEVILASRDGAYYAYKNNCPHLNISLEFLEQQFMDMDHEYLMCSNHGALFDVTTGACVYGPCQGESLEPVDIQVDSNGDVWLTG